MPPSGKIALLMVEDDASIRYLQEVAIARAGIFAPVAVVEDGQAALDWLQQREKHALPDMIVTDLSMPRLTGVELLRALKADERFNAIPVGVITSSNIPHDREDAFAAGARAFFHKPQGLDAMTKTLLGLRDACFDPHYAPGQAA